MKNGLIITFDGSVAKKENCKYIKGDFYEVNSQCFFIESRWYRINSGYIVYDNEKGEYVLKSSDLVNGIIGVKDDDWDIGFFSCNPAKNVLVKTGTSEIIAIAEEALKSKKLVEIQYSTKEVFVNSEEYIKTLKTLPKVQPYKDTDRLLYSSLSLLREAEESYNKYYFNHKKLDEYNCVTTNSEASRLVGTFGIEFESQIGRIPTRFLYRLGLIPLRDGSIVGDEYATIPFGGCSKHLRTLEDIMDVMKKYVQIDADNSLHIHQRLQDFSKEYFISSFLVNSVIETEIFNLFPAFYSRTSMFKRSGKDYNNPLPNLKSLQVSNPVKNLFGELYVMYSNGRTFAQMDNRTNIPHPDDPGGDHKWQISNRYTWVNYIPYLFGGSNTIEYRIHPPTLNFYKVIAWVYITNAILAFSKIIESEICNCSNVSNYLVDHVINLTSIITTVYPEESYARELCLKYIAYRKSIRKHMDGMGDGSGAWELKNDQEFVFN